MPAAGKVAEKALEVDVEVDNWGFDDKVHVAFQVNIWITHIRQDFYNVPDSFRWVYSGERSLVVVVDSMGYSFEVGWECYAKVG